MKDNVSDLNALTEEDLQDVLNNLSLQGSGSSGGSYGVPQTVGSSVVSNSTPLYGTPSYVSGAIVNLPYIKQPVYGHPSMYGGMEGTSLNLFPYAGLNLSDDDIKLIMDFKIRQPDFDSLEAEITLVLLHQPGLGNTPLFMSILYETAKKLHKICEECIDSEGASGIVDGAPEKD